MRVTVYYTGQLRTALGRSADSLELAGPCAVAALLCHVAAQNAEAGRFLFRPDGKLDPSLLLVLGDRQVRADDPTPVGDGAAVTILMPIAGG